MILHLTWLLVVLAWHQAWLVPVVHGVSGRALGETCLNYNECGDYPKSAMLCDKVCKCFKSMYFEETKSMCVSYIGEKCDAVEPTDAIKLEFKCGENAHCFPSMAEKFGRCRCNSGYKVNFERKCVHMSSSRVSEPVNVHSRNHPNHPKYGNEGSNQISNQGSNGNNGIVSFPFESANSKARISSDSSLKFQPFTLVLFATLSLILPYIHMIRCNNMILN